MQTKEAPAGRACRVTPSTASLLNHLVDFYQRPASCLDEGQKVEKVALLVEFADVFACFADDLGRTCIVEHEINTNGSKLPRQNHRCLPDGSWPRQT